MVVEAVRLLITLVVTAVGFQLGDSLSDRFPDVAGLSDTSSVVGAVLGAGVGYVGGGIFGRGFRSRLETVPDRVVPRVSGTSLFAGAFGVLTGLMIGIVVSIPIVLLLPPTIGWPLSALIVLLIILVAVRVFMARADDLLAVAGLRIRGPLRSISLEDGERAHLIDSSAAIDGRLLALVQSGLVEGRLWVPTFVIDELQGLADAGEGGLRRRGRRGLEALEALHSATTELTVLEESVPEFEDVDAKLLALASRAGARLVTTDYNLAKAAELRGIVVLNPGVLGEKLKPIVGSGETLTVMITKSGKGAGQGVAYLDDGTMVVVEDAGDLIGEELEIVVTSSTRTAVGRMLFARPAL
ncbi:MAG: TRAM domain-containing protein [Acidimicrobiia bacterium]|nr:TRAM domain-containing protein [Acidimicrobiia bacterium]